MIGRLVAGRYRIERLIGQGGMGAVYAAVNEETRHRAAIKLLFPEYASDERWVERLFLEAQAVNIVSHSGLVRIYDCGFFPEDNGGRTGYILMEFLEGESLFRRAGRLWQAGQHFPVPEAGRIIRQAADALSAVHGKGIVHRDLKPENLFLVPDPEVRGGERVKVLDFGVAKFQDTKLVTHKTTVDRVVGTPVYMSPEQCRGVPLSGKSDVYALGVVLYELVAGRLPFVDDDAVSVMTMHLRDAPPPITAARPEAQMDVVRLIEEMLRKEPQARPTMAEVAERLEALTESGQTPTRSAARVTVEGVVVGGGAGGVVGGGVGGDEAAPRRSAAGPGGAVVPSARSGGGDAATGRAGGGDGLADHARDGEVARGGDGPAGRARGGDGPAGRAGLDELPGASDRGKSGQLTDVVRRWQAAPGRERLLALVAVVSVVLMAAGAVRWQLAHTPETAVEEAVPARPPSAGSAPGEAAGPSPSVAVGTGAPPSAVDGTGAGGADGAGTPASAEAVTATSAAPGEEAEVRTRSRRHRRAASPGRTAVSPGRVAAAPLDQAPAPAAAPPPAPAAERRSLRPQVAPPFVPTGRRHIALPEVRGLSPVEPK